MVPIARRVGDGGGGWKHAAPPDQALERPPREEGLQHELRPRPHARGASRRTLCARTERLHIRVRSAYAHTAARGSVRSAHTTVRAAV